MNTPSDNRAQTHSTQLDEQTALELYGGRRFNSYAGYFRRTFGGRMQKVAINAGFTCPNRDGKISIGGCTFCNNAAFTPSYCTPQLSVTEQIEEGIAFHRNRYRTAESYLAYFQSFSNTYAPLDDLRKLYNEALAHPQVAGVIIGTRPDCVDDEKLDYFAQLAREKYVAIEYGVESCYDASLERINRGHTFDTARSAIERSAARGINTGAHFILGLPGESDEMLISQVDAINALPLTTVKFHQLQIFKDTTMAAEYDAAPESFRFWKMEEYIDLFIKILERLRPDIVMERFASEAPPRYHHGENWGLIRNETLLNLFERELARRNTYQGRHYRADYEQI
ncbi:MAG: TIGR01212 family radical SAM protein [Rikenellaceae bacterium]